MEWKEEGYIINLYIFVKEEWETYTVILHIKHTNNAHNITQESLNLTGTKSRPPGTNYNHPAKPSPQFSEGSQHSPKTNSNFHNYPHLKG